jgi:hypothetical protein
MGTWRNGPLERKSREFADKKLDAGVGFDPTTLQAMSLKTVVRHLTSLNLVLRPKKKLEGLRGLWAGKHSAQAPVLVRLSSHARLEYYLSLSADFAWGCTAQQLS